MQRKVLHLPNVELSFLEWDQYRDKELLILLHGLADHGLVWSSLGDYLASDYHIVAPDLRGHGDSSKPQEGYSFREIIGDLEGLMDHFGVDKAYVLAHSWSAKLLAIWATLSPARFNSIILVDPFFIGSIPSWFKITFPILYKVLPFLKLMGPFSSYQEAEKIARQLKQYRGWSLLQQQVFEAAMVENADGSWESKFIVAARNEIFVEVMEVAGLTAQIDIPTLLVIPEKGLNRTQWQLKPYHTYISHLDIARVPGNHWAFLVEPEAFNQAIADFLSRV